MIRKGFTTFTLTLFVFICFGQSVDEPFKKANTILIKTNMDNNQVFINWGKHLLKNGFSIDKSNKDFLSLITGPKDTSRLNYDFIINSSISDSGIIFLNIKFRLKSNILTGTSETEFYDWEYAKAKGNVLNIIYNDILPTIESFGEYEVKYEKR